MKKILNKSLLTGDKYTQRWIYINLNLHIVHVDLLLTLMREIGNSKRLIICTFIRKSSTKFVYRMMLRKVVAWVRL